MNTSIPSYAGDFESDSVVQDPYSQYGTPTNPNVSASVMMELIWVVAKLFERPYAALVGDKYGYIDKTGKFIIPSQFDNAHSFSEGLAAVQIGKKWGFIDKTGNFVIPPQFYNANSFSEGLAAVQICEEGSDNGCGKWKWGYIDKTGNVAIQPQFYNADSFSEGLAVVEICV
ncbi:WG repeat-containing protein, partial [Leptospira weilii]